MASPPDGGADQMIRSSVAIEIVLTLCIASGTSDALIVTMSEGEPYP
jgi:hypothetical protein